MTTNSRKIEPNDHSFFMHRALELATANLGQTWPNPSVGAVVVKDGTIVGEGATARGGRPHAETQALRQAGERAKGATLYVTLEPCAHHGKTPPCADAVIAAGIARAVVACGDPAPHVGGKGIARMNAAGIDVIEGICEQEAREFNRGFISIVERNRPYVALKIATSADGKIAATPGTQTRITGEAALKHVHLLRSRYDALVTGIGTVLVDDPLLTCRLEGLEDKSPVRVVLDSQLRIPADSNLVKTADKVPLWIIARPPLEGGQILHQKNRGGYEKIITPHGSTLSRLLPLKGGAIKDVLSLLAEKGITRVLVEAGKTLNTAFLRSGFVDRVYWFKSPETIGKDGLDAAAGGLSVLAQWRRLEHTAFPPDTLDILEPCSQAS